MDATLPTDLGKSGAYAVEHTSCSRLSPSARAKKQFARTDRPTDALKIFRQGGRYYLLNRANTAIDRIRFESARRHVRLRNESDGKVRELCGLPARSYVPVGSVRPRSHTEAIYRLFLADWQDGPTWSGEQMLRVYSPNVVPHRLGRLGLQRMRMDTTPARTAS
jgi:hypothetical protein